MKKVGGEGRDPLSKMNYLKEKRVRIEGEGLFVKKERVYQGENNLENNLENNQENNQNSLVEKDDNIQLSHG